MAVAMGALFSYGVFFKALLTEFGWTRGITAGAYSLNVVLQGILGIVAGRLSDKLGPRILITGGGLIAGLGYLLMFQISAIWHLYLLFGVTAGIGFGAIYVPTISTVARWFIKRRGLMTGIVVSGIGAGVVIMPPLVTQFISVYGWRISYLFVGTIVLVVVVTAAQFLKSDPSQLGQFPDGEREVRQEGLTSEVRGFSLQEAIHNKQFWMLFAIFFGVGISLDSIYVHIIPHATDLGFSAKTAAWILSIIGGLSIAGRIGIGIIGDRTSIKLALIITLTILSIALFWLLGVKGLWMLYIFTIVFGLSYGGVMVLISPLTADLFGLSSHGAIFGTVLFAFTIGAAIGPLSAGRAYDITGGYQLAFLMFAVLSVISLILAFLLKRPHKSD